MKILKFWWKLDKHIKYFQEKKTCIEYINFVSCFLSMDSKINDTWKAMLYELLGGKPGLGTKIMWAP